MSPVAPLFQVPWIGHGAHVSTGSGEKKRPLSTEDWQQRSKEADAPLLDVPSFPPSSCLGPASHSAYEHAASIVSGWDFDRIIPCHGAVIESGGKHAWDSTFQKVLESGRARQAK